MNEPVREPHTFLRLRIGCFIDASGIAVNGIIVLRSRLAVFRMSDSVS